MASSYKCCGYSGHFLVGCLSLASSAKLIVYQSKLTSYKHGVNSLTLELFSNHLPNRKSSHSVSGYCSALAQVSYVAWGSSMKNMLQSLHVHTISDCPAMRPSWIWNCSEGARGLPEQNPNATWGHLQALLLHLCCTKTWAGGTCMCSHLECIAVCEEVLARCMHQWTFVFTPYASMCVFIISSIQTTRHGIDNLQWQTTEMYAISEAFVWFDSGLPYVLGAHWSSWSVYSYYIMVIILSQYSCWISCIVQNPRISVSVHVVNTHQLV